MTRLSVSSAGSSTFSTDDGTFPFAILSANSGSLECPNSVFCPSSSVLMSLVNPNALSENQENCSPLYVEAINNCGLISSNDDEIDAILTGKWFLKFRRTVIFEK